MSQDCPCTSGRPYEQCCGPLHRRTAPAATAEALMRSRYAAYVLGLSDYLARSWHPDTRPAEPISTDIRWVGLEITGTNRGGTGDKQGEVAFRAYYLDGDHLGCLAENSRFLRLDGDWLYVDGDPLPEAGEGRRIGRNEPCPCGSGAKFKRCCGK